jgi:hypothetical protein
MTTTTEMKVGDVSMPIHTEIPGAWVAEIDSPIWGRVQVEVNNDKLRAGQRVNLKYHVGRLSGRPEVVGLRLQSGWLKPKTFRRLSL